MSELTWPTPFGYTIFCDDVRQEILNKITYVGIYRGDLKVMAEPPAHLPKLALAIAYYEKMGKGSEPLELMIYLPSDTDIPTQTIPIPPRDHAPTKDADGEELLAVLNFAIEIAPFNITGPGKLRVRMKKGDDTIRLGALRVTIATPEERAAAGFARPVDADLANNANPEDMKQPGNPS